MAIIPKGQSLKIKGSECNMSVKIMDISTLLPRQANINGLVIIKLNIKLEYRAHVYFKPVRQDIALRLLLFLKDNNYLYKDITIVPSTIPISLVDLFQTKNA